MKKTYQKPAIVIENFMLTEMIASCAYSVNIQTTSNCVTNLGDSTLMEAWKKIGLFNNSEACKDAVPEGQLPGQGWNGDKLCYQSSQGMNVFSS